MTWPSAPSSRVCLVCGGVADLENGEDEGGDDSVDHVWDGLVVDVGAEKLVPFIVLGNKSDVHT